MSVAFVRVEQLRKGTLMTPDIKRILVPLDFSVNSSRALDYAHGMAVQFGAAIHLVHVCEVPTLMSASMDAYAIAYSDWSQRLGEEAEMQLVREKARLTDVTVTTEVLFGNPAASIIDAAGANHADLIVMGTHGHGAVMHMVMGNVAERVVRGAPCPVLTVREPRVKEVDRGLAKKLAVAGTVLAAFLLIPAAASAQDQPMKQSTPGAETFRTYCATCHGASARGDGPLAASMRRKPANLTEIAKRNGGAFPSELIFKVIDGRQPVRGHGGPDMPAWGDAFSRSREAGDDERVKSVIQALVAYLEGIQLRAAHDQQQ
jgi:nucleotide-binding universal stress UspA family protein/mono/diheme cytochrome c family protein